MIHTTFEARLSQSNPDHAFGGNLRNPGIWNELGNSLIKVGAYDDAIDAYKNAIDIDPGYGWSYSNLAVLCTVQGKLAEAVTLCKKSIRLLNDKKGQAIAWARLGEAYRQLGQYEQAMSAYQAADELNEARATQRIDLRQADPEQIISHPNPSRAQTGMDDLIESIRIHGIIQPLIVCPAQGEPGRFTLISGSRRLEAARKLGLTEVPVIVRQANKQEILELWINENDHRFEPNLLELAKNYRRLADDFNLSLDQVCARVGKSPYFVTNTLSLLDLPEDLQIAISENHITQEQANILAQLSTSQSRQFALQYVVKNDLNPGQTEDLIFRMNTSQTENNAHIFPASSSSEQDKQECDDCELEQPDDGHNPGNSSLVSRARYLLKSNPQVERHWAAPSYRA